MRRRRSRSSARLGTRDSVVLDASALVRGLMALDPRAVDWLDGVAGGRIRAVVPELAFAETGHALARYVHAGMLAGESARALLQVLARLPLTVESMRALVEPALIVALARRLTVYDACYAALAEAGGAVLVTADRRLAAAVPRSALLPAAAPPA